jgi:hypothetical protein
MHKPSAKSSFSVDSPATAHTYGRGKAVISLTAPPPVWASLPSSMAQGIAEICQQTRGIDVACAVMTASNVHAAGSDAAAAAKGVQTHTSFSSVGAATHTLT